MLFNFIKSKNRKDIKKEKNKGIFKRFLIPIKKLKILKFFLKKKYSKYNNNQKEKKNVNSHHRQIND